MKMEHQIKAPAACIVERLCVKLGQAVEAGSVVAILVKG